eukprot:3516449-Rhodomonas_salina.2
MRGGRARGRAVLGNASAKADTNDLPDHMFLQDCTCLGRRTTDLRAEIVMLFRHCFRSDLRAMSQVRAEEVWRTWSPCSLPEVVPLNARTWAAVAFSWDKK